ncbi:glycosyltransferase [Methylophaga sp.]|uniref:glycosyltransferase n=1 Tax=Methylophaga sp. TaxID=2024840 RepID=UPI0013FEC893|nr:glycosyltransferase [Methylophaga sp.]MTI64698.1 glycosyltransferase [Methylophaga sp.]
MRIVIDMQGAQASNKNRGIGRYSLALAKAIVHNRNNHEVLLALNGIFEDTIEFIRAEFYGLLPQENIRVWNMPAGVSYNKPNVSKRKSAEMAREAFLAGLKPDLIHVTSLFEGLGDDAVTSIGAFTRNIPTSVTLYDLIPYIYQKPYLENSVVRPWYLEKIDHLRRADLWLAISESSRQEGIEHLALSDEFSVNVSTDADSQFSAVELTDEQGLIIRNKYQLDRPFVMYTGGIDHRKNIEGLIRAYAQTPEVIRDAHQLAIVCSIQPEMEKRLLDLVFEQGLNKTDVVFTDYVPEEDLIQLYNLCSLFVFPSWHEGFGLPALEAIRCGALVIGANTSSLPEVIGLDEALFDPHSNDSMARMIEKGLTDTAFRQRLSSHLKQQSELFSWDETGKRAIKAMESLYEKEQGVASKVNLTKPKMAYVSPLPPEKSGIADYSAELLPALAEFYDIDVIVNQQVVSSEWINKNCSIRDVDWLINNSGMYDRVVYHLGNSTFHEHMFGLLQQIPGVVVLHDFYLSGIIAHMDVHGSEPGLWNRSLYHGHGYKSVKERFEAKDTADIVWKYPCSLDVIQQSLGMIAHSPASLDFAKQWYSCDTSEWRVIPLVREPNITPDITQARERLGFAEDDFLVCAFGVMGPTKLNQELLDAWLMSQLVKDRQCHLIFVGENHPGDYGKKLLATIKKNNLQNRVHIAGWTSPDTFRDYLISADLAVQLRTLSRGETSAAVLDCMNHSLATIVNANGSMAYLDDNAVCKLPDEFSVEQLTQSLEYLRNNDDERHRLGVNARRLVLTQHTPEKCADKYHQAIEAFYSRTSAHPHSLIKALGVNLDKSITSSELAEWAAYIARNHPVKDKAKQLFVDVSELVKQDAKSGIQRVVRSILKHWFESPPEGYRVEPVYASEHQGYRYARRFTLQFLGCPAEALHDEPIDYATGDLFIGLDLHPQVQVSQRSFYQELRRAGVKVVFTVYDLLCVNMPQFFAPGAKEGFERWLEVVAENDGAVCISKSVSDELADWLSEQKLSRLRPFKIDWFHLGADVNNSLPTKGLPENAGQVLSELQERESFLMVGTIEPRKGHAQVLDAFDLLWSEGKQLNLVIVGKQGWMVEDLVSRFRSHPELNKRLYWLDGISDEYLEKVYAASNCLIAASYGEGFGLPLIEAAQHKLPIIAREIPVFREVAVEHAFYFQGFDAKSLAGSIKQWLALYQERQNPFSEEMAWLRWKDSSAAMLQKVIN